jgi:hypothetical protein
MTVAVSIAVVIDDRIKTVHSMGQCYDYLKDKASKSGAVILQSTNLIKFSGKQNNPGYD